MATKHSAGILLFRRTESSAVEFLLVNGAWTIPKGGLEDGEDPRDCALREMGEELGPAPALALEDLIELGSVRQRAGKVVEAWAAEADFDPAALASNTFTMEWPPRSGKAQEFPEVDRAEWFNLERARSKILPAQGTFLDRLLEHLGLPVG